MERQRVDRSWQASGRVRERQERAPEPARAAGLARARPVPAWRVRAMLLWERLPCERRFPSWKRPSWWSLRPWSRLPMIVPWRGIPRGGDWPRLLRGETPLRFECVV